MKSKLFLSIFVSFLLLLFSVNAVTDEDLRSETQAYYTLDDDFISGTSIIDSVGNYNGTNNGATCGVTGQINEACNFDGSDEITLSSEIQFSDSQDHSISYWIYPNSLGHQVLGKNDNSKSFIQHTSDEIVYASQGNTYTRFNYISSTDTWTHIVFTTENDNINLYVDGILEQTLSADGGDSSMYINAIGKGHDSHSPWVGKIDEVSIWNKKLTSDEVSELYNRQLNDLSGSQYDFTSEPTLDITINNHVDGFNYTYDINQTLLNITTNLNATNCNYTYQNETYSMTKINNTQYEEIFNMGIANESKQEFNIAFSCYSETYNQSANDSVTFYREQVPLDLQIFVPEDQQEFNEDINQIEFYIETNYQATCYYLVYNMTSYEPFNYTTGAIHKTNYSTFYPNISEYNTSFKCEGILVNENITKNVTFYLLKSTIDDETAITQTNEAVVGSFGVIGVIVAEVVDLSTNSLFEMVIIVMIISTLLGLLGIILYQIRIYFKANIDKKR